MGGEGGGSGSGGGCGGSVGIIVGIITTIVVGVVSIPVSIQYLIQPPNNLLHNFRTIPPITQHFQLKQTIFNIPLTLFYILNNRYIFNILILTICL